MDSSAQGDALHKRQEWGLNTRLHDSKALIFFHPKTLFGTKSGGTEQEPWLHNIVKPQDKGLTGHFPSINVSKNTERPKFCSDSIGCIFWYILTLELYLLIASILLWICPRSFACLFIPGHLSLSSVFCPVDSFSSSILHFWVWFFFFMFSSVILSDIP